MLTVVSDNRPDKKLGTKRGKEERKQEDYTGPFVITADLTLRKYYSMSQDYVFKTIYDQWVIIGCG